MTSEWTLDQLVHYLGTWSATQRFMAARGSDPLPEIKAGLKDAWGRADRKRIVVWPLILRLGRNNGANEKVSA
jgi:hypothetical protein